MHAIIEPKIKFDELLSITKSKLKSDAYYYIIKKNKHCFSVNINKDIDNANNVISSVKSNNSGHITAAALLFGFNHFYGKDFNPKYLVSRSHEISKFTTRLTKQDIVLIRQKFQEWIKLDDRLIDGKECYSLYPKRRLMHVFESLLCSGMRLGELLSIKFSTSPAHRIVKSSISGKEFAEIIINTEKTCKKREVYIPIESYNFFVSTLSDPKKKLYKVLITKGFIDFRKWAKLPFKLSSHVLRRTKATIMHEIGVDIGTIALTLGNTVGVVQKHYILSSGRNFDACDMANCAIDGIVVKTSNPYLNPNYMKKNKPKDRIDDLERLMKS